MPKSNSWCQGIEKLLFQATAMANIADNAASSPLTNLYISLHTTSPGASGSQTTNEATYTSYARVAVARTSSGFTLTSQTITFAANVAFPAATGGSETETFIGIGTASSGTGVLLYYGAISPTIVVTSGVTPTILAASTIIES